MRLIPADTVTNVCCLGVIGVVMCTFVGYVLKMPWMYYWGVAGMTPNTACCLLVLALAQMQARIMDEKKFDKRRCSIDETTERRKSCPAREERQVGN